jgi:predicted metalloprotease with PDZ domain
VTREHPTWYPYYIPHNITTLFSDDNGSLNIHASGPGTDKYLIERDTKGDVVAAWKVPVFERNGIGRTSPGSVCELLRDQCGMIGVGKYFIPQFRLGDKVPITTEWDLSNCPQGTRAVTSFGEGRQRIQFTGDPDSLLDCVFMAGPIRSHTDGSKSLTSQDEGACGTYWFGDLPPNLDAIIGYAANIFPRMSEHFNDPSGSYRTFLRRAPKGFQGTAFRSSSIIEYDASVKDEDDWDLVRLLNRTMVSTWARLDPEDDGAANAWFTDGLALLYTVFLPFRFGQRGPDYFRATVNAFLSAYYTNPLVAGGPNSASRPLDTHGLGWYASSAKAYRAFVYMLKMDAFTRRATVAGGSDVLRPMDELVRELLGRRRAGEKVQKRHWLEGVARWLGKDEAERCFREMLDEGGRVNELDDMLSSFGAKFGPQPVEQEVLDFGFDRESLDMGNVVGVEENSRAWEAGLRNGDKVSRHSRPEACEIDVEKNLRLSVERHGDKFDFDYWPRSREKVRCWQVLEGKYEPK